MNARRLLLALALCLSACASTTAPQGAASPQDPWEGMNRKVFAFNDRLDRKLLKPAAKAYQSTVPTPVRDAVSNVFGNLGDAWSAINWLLQGQVQRGLEQGARVAWNSTLGLGGMFDVGSHFGLNKHSQDFGQTLGAWGMGLGPYVVLPVLGPSSVRDMAALPLNRMVSSNLLTDEASTRSLITLLEVVSVRAGLLGAEKVVEGIALDKYTFLRDAYLQRRGAKPRKAEDDDGFELVSPEPTASAAKP